MNIQYEQSRIPDVKYEIRENISGNLSCQKVIQSNF